MPAEQPNGAKNGYDSESEEKLIADAIESAHDLPGYYPVVVIARRDLAFKALLEATVAAEQGDAPFQIRERESSKGTYVSYRVEMFVATAEDALERKALLANLPGVLVLL